MDVMKYLGCIVCLVLMCGTDFLVAQDFFGRSIYPRGGILGGSLYPRYPIGYPRGGLYPHYPRRDIYDPSIYPVVDGVGIRRRPVISDRSDTRRQNINVSNNNENVREEVGSGNVHVNQVTSTRSRNCECQVGMFMGQCGPYRQCVADSSCTGGNNGVCREAGFMGGHGGMMI